MKISALLESVKVKGLRTLGEGFANVLEADIEWEPQPEFRGRGGKTTATHDSAKRQRGMKDGPSTNRRYDQVATQDHPDSEKLNQFWMTFLQRLKSASPEDRKALGPTLKKIALGAKKRGVTLRPDPSQFGL